MVATVVIVRLTSTTPDETSISGGSTRVSASDNPTPGINTPIPIPASGVNFSFWAHAQLRVDADPTTAIDNFRFYLDGANSFGTGVTGLANKTSGYVLASGTVSTTGVELTTVNHSQLFSSAQDIFSYTSTTPLTLNGSTSVTGLIGDLVVWQLRVSAGAGAGATPSETFTFLYDET